MHIRTEGVRKDVVACEDVFTDPPEMLTVYVELEWGGVD